MYSMTYFGGGNGGNMSRRKSDADVGDHYFFKLIEIPFSPFQNDMGDDVDDDDDLDFAGSAVQRRSCNSTTRQEYLRSYTFSRNVVAGPKPTLKERVKSRLGRLTAAAWAAVTCNPYNLPRRVRRIKDKLALRSARLSLQRSRNNTSACRVPFLQPCFRA